MAVRYTDQCKKSFYALSYFVQIRLIVQKIPHFEKKTTVCRIV